MIGWGDGWFIRLDMRPMGAVSVKDGPIVT